jgi:hypothetical protein
VVNVAQFSGQHHLAFSNRPVHPVVRTLSGG